eukprot:GILK01002223.1.p1 GENE.GILK01002223.1~~GILK01002223.1.p1  ORF type:complete len:426 (+),score=37.67 GILK01002223.1:63-1280(+)
MSARGSDMELRERRNAQNGGSSSPQEQTCSNNDTKNVGATVDESGPAPVSCILFDCCSVIIAGLRVYLMGQINWGVGVLLRYSRLRTPFLTKYFGVASWLGSEEFYVLQIPFLYYLLENTSFVRQFVLLVMSGYYIGNVLKNMLCLPRPPRACLIDPNSSVLDNTGYGWPSTHSINATTLPFFVLRFIYGHSSPLQSPDFGKPHMAIAYAVGIFWTLSISFSRLYLAVHTPADVQGGMMLGGLMLQLWMVFAEPVELWILGHPNGASLILLSFALSLLLFPRVNVAGNKTFEESVIISSFAHSFLFGCWWRPVVKAVPLSCDLIGLTSSFVLLCSLFVSRFILKRLLAYLLPLCGLPLSTVKKATRDSDFTAGDLLIKMAVYWSFGLLVTVICPAVYETVGLWKD